MPRQGRDHSVLVTGPGPGFRYVEDVMKGNAELRFEDVVIRTSLIAAPILMLLSGLVLPQLHGPDGTELSVSASYPGRYYAYVLLGLAGSVALVPAVYAITRRTRLRRARLGAIGGSLAFTGAALSLADWGGELVKVEMGALSTTHHHAMVALLGRFDSSARIAAPRPDGYASGSSPGRSATSPGSRPDRSPCSTSETPRFSPAWDTSPSGPRRSTTHAPTAATTTPSAAQPERRRTARPPRLRKRTALLPRPHLRCRTASRPSCRTANSPRQIQATGCTGRWSQRPPAGAITAINAAVRERALKAPTIELAPSQTRLPPIRCAQQAAAPYSKPRHVPNAIDNGGGTRPQNGMFCITSTTSSAPP